MLSNRKLETKQKRHKPETEVAICCRNEQRAINKIDKTITKEATAHNRMRSRKGTRSNPRSRYILPGNMWNFPTGMLEDDRVAKMIREADVDEELNTQLQAKP